MAEPGRDLRTARAIAVACLVGGGAFLVVALATSLDGWTTTTRTLAALGMAGFAFGAGLLLAAPGLYLPDPSPARRFAQVALPVCLLALFAPAAAALTVQALPTDTTVVASAPVTAVASDPSASTTLAAQWPPPPPVYGGANSNIDQDLAGTARAELAGTATTAAANDASADHDHSHTGSTVAGEGSDQWANQVQAQLGGGLQQALTGDSAAPTTEAAAPAASVAPGAFDEAELATHEHGTATPEVPLDAATRAELGTQMVTARSVALQYPTVADAEAAGYVKVTGYVPLIGAHYVKWSLMDGTFQVDQPEMLLYDGTDPGSHIVGLSYYVFGPTGPEGFAGPNDHWHQHRGLCMKGLLVVGGEKLTPEECAARGGQKVDGANGWMVHAWVVPGWESPEGVFSPEHPGLT